MKPLYATQDLNVGGRRYVAGEQIECSEGNRESLTLNGWATTREPQAVPDNPGQDDPSETDEDSLDTLGLDQPTIQSLRDNEIQDLDQLIDYIDNGGRLRDLKGIGQATEKRIQESIERYLSDGE